MDTHISPELISALNTKAENEQSTIEACQHYARQYAACKVDLAESREGLRDAINEALDCGWTQAELCKELKITRATLRSVLGY